jgi:hypothetical protein
LIERGGWGDGCTLLERIGRGIVALQEKGISG